MKTLSKRMAGVFGLLVGLLLLAGTAFTSVPPKVIHPESRVIQQSDSGVGRSYSVAFSPDGSLLAVGSSSGIYFYDARGMRPIRYIPTQTTVRALAFSPDGSNLASGSYDPVVRIWRVEDGELLKELRGHSAWVRSVAYSPDGNLLATASDDDSAVLWDVKQGHSILVLGEKNQGVRAVAFSPDGGTLATGGFDNVVRLWKVSDGSLSRELVGHTGWIRTLAFSPGGETLASGGFDATVRLWRVTDGALLVTRTEHSSSVLSMAFSPDGRLLASASVDTEVRIWQMPDLTPYDRLSGHLDFVYGVAFSSDGKSLASSAADNSVRLWDVPPGRKVAANQRVSTPSNCKACHHPRTDTIAPRVIETGCATCHRDGALVRTWCPVFDRAPGGTTSNVSYAIPSLEGGVPHTTSDFGVVISTPGNGEHFYTPREIFTFTRINGSVFSKTGRIEDIKIQLGIWSEDKQIAVLSAVPGADGNYSFPVNIRGEGGDPYPDMDGQKFNCSNCHKAEKAILPSGEVRIVVTATMPDGRQAFDERIINVDNSISASIPVNVVLENGQPLAGVPLQASARLYEWRGRTFTALTAAGGSTLSVEALSEIPTKYTILVPPVLLDGVVYESVEPVGITLTPGSASSTPVTLRVRSSTGYLAGQLDPSSASPVTVSAIHLPDGVVHRTQSSLQGSFTFPDLPVGRYLVVASQEDLISQGLRARPQLVDLTQAPSDSVNLKLIPGSGGTLQVAVNQEEGPSVPFAYLEAERLDLTQPVSPDSGQLTLHGLPREPFTLIVSAPGFYSQAHLVDAAQVQTLALTLARRPETRELAWGGGHVSIPPETLLSIQGFHIMLEQGWLWGSGGGTDPLKITLDGAEIEIGSGSFALEHFPGEQTWLYVFEGNARLRPGADMNAVELSGGQMLVLEHGAQPVPVPYQPDVFAALQPFEEAPTDLIWQQTVEAQIRDRLAQIGISTAQAFTLLTYLLAIPIVILIPILLARQLFNTRKEKKHS